MIKRIRRGLKNHPGIQMLCFLVGIGALAGVGHEDGVIRIVGGGLVMLAIFGPMVLYSAWKIGKDHPHD